MNGAGILLRLQHATRSYGGVHALRDVSLDVRAGEVHALCGENGAGKSTLIKSLTGVVALDAGTIEIDEVRLPAGNVTASEAAGVAVMHQESTAFPDLTAVENIFVGREPRVAGWFLDHRRMHREADRLLRELGQEIPLTRPVRELSLAQRQMVVMARALSRECRVLIMDEPTASLSAREAETLLQIVRRLRDTGVAILFVSHRLDEVFQLADHVTVLRDGSLVASDAIAKWDRDRLVQAMVGRTPAMQSPVAADRAPAPSALPAAAGGATSLRRNAAALSVRGLTRHGAFAEVSFEVHRGEIVGVAGLVGAGRSELARAVFGLDRYDHGQVRVNGRLLPAAEVRAAMRHGMALVPEDRQHEGLVLPMSVRDNLSLAVLPRISPCGWIRRRQEHELVDRQLAELQVRAANRYVAAETLSGGNQQKLVLAKWLACEPRILLLDEPTRGVDVGAKEQVHQLVRRLAGRGMATLLISSELPELLALCDRILVMREGRLVAELPRAEASQETLLRLALPGAPMKRDQQAADPDPDPDCRGSGPVSPGRAAGARSIVRIWLDPPDPPHGRTMPPTPGRERIRRPAFPGGEFVLPRLWRLAAQRETGLTLLILLLSIIVGQRDATFFTLANWQAIITRCAPTAMVACGVMLVVVTGEIDISVGSSMALLAAWMGLLLSEDHLGLPLALGLPLTLLLGTAIGVANGFLVTAGRVPSIIVTLGMLTALRGSTTWVMRGENIAGLPDGWSNACKFGLHGCPVPLGIVAAGAVIGLTVGVMKQMPLGRRLRAVGSSPYAARMIGLSVTRGKLFAFAYTGFLTALATIVDVPRLPKIEAGIGVGFELLVVTCVVVGGVSITGGRGRLRGVLLAVLLMTMIRPVLTFVAVGEAGEKWTKAIQGMCIMAAVIVDSFVARRRRERAGR